ncbi:DUF6461 domain-containing protein [Amycolatopsis sp. NPDC098790]|uniref:DUF6461 domain-containing protein n=1 Tax=Amycolatopsis sp. NPDC098790 TaxID=3363939 RepID=UPI00382A40DE
MRCYVADLAMVGFMTAEGDFDADLGWVLDPAMVMWCLTCVRRVSAEDLLAAAGATTVADARWDAGQAQSEAHHRGGAGVRVASSGDWSILIELQSLKGADGEWLQSISRGGEAVCFYHSGSGMERFSHAVDGVLVTEFEPAIPARRSGTEPDRLVADMRAAGIDPDGVTGDGDLGVAALRLVERVSGVRLTSDLVISGRWPAGVILRRRRG